jgi:hypothetical protein
MCYEYGNTRQGNFSPSELISDYNASNGWIIVNNIAEIVWKPVLVAQFRVISGCSAGDIEYNDEKLRIAEI